MRPTPILFPNDSSVWLKCHPDAMCVAAVPFTSTERLLAGEDAPE